jgi:hypothetical protein
MGATVVVEPGKVVAGDPSVGTATLESMAQGATSPDPLSSDPEVAALLSLWPNAICMEMGTGLIVRLSSRLYRNASLLRSTSFPLVPIFGGATYLSGGASNATLLAAATYPTPADVQSASSVVGTLMQGYDPMVSVPYSHLWNLDSMTVQGSTLIVRLTTLRAGAVGISIDQNFMPCFWAPST